MIVNINTTLAAVEQVLPWNLVIRLDDVDYSTRAPTVGELAILEGRSNNSEIRPTLAALFVSETKPDVSTWSEETTACVLSAVLLAFRDKVQKNFRSIARATANAMGINLPAEKSASGK